MVNRYLIVLLRALAIAIVSAIAPVKLVIGQPVILRQACAAGTCCKETTSICNDGKNPDKVDWYYNTAACLH